QPPQQRWTPFSCTWVAVWFGSRMFFLGFCRKRSVAGEATRGSQSRPQPSTLPGIERAADRLPGIQAASERVRISKALLAELQRRTGAVLLFGSASVHDR